MRKAFKAYDIRGIYNIDFNADDVYKIGFFLPELLKADKILIGMDARTSSNEIFDSLSKGICDAGANVDFAGHTTTPMIYWATAKYGYQASVMITASHNPSNYNGLKISRHDALPVGFDSGLSELLNLAENKPVAVVSNKGKVNSIDFKDDYLNFLLPYLTDLSNLNIAVDCSNGMASLLVRKLLGDKPLYIYDTIDGTFPNHEPNPLEQENVRDLSKAVITNKCDVGVIFDGDADRVMFVDEEGKFIQPDMMIALLADYFFASGKKGICLQDIRTSKSVTEYVEEKGFSMHIWRVGRAYAALKLREIDGLFGGELAGHYYFRDFYYSDSAYLAALIILGEISKAKSKGISLSQLIDRISHYYGSGELNFHIENKKEAMSTLLSAMIQCEEPMKTLDFDGYRLEFKDWWFNVRPSNTEPYLRLLIEAKTPYLLQEKTAQAIELLEPFKVPYSHGQ